MPNQPIFWGNRNWADHMGSRRVVFGAAQAKSTVKYLRVPEARAEKIFRFLEYLLPENIPFFGSLRRYSEKIETVPNVQVHEGLFRRARGKSENESTASTAGASGENLVFVEID